ncbi:MULTISPECIES: hypothetical protein [unclassified Streptomyces]|uniref:hypothetical protein n=1 Tax=unclassified Streptomyces TaxID=2593676 RepID=UPI0008DE9143|nr:MULTISPECIES: hypothetical protein [unclassified Streptomyces]OII69312.1 hypothetical protein BJP39_00030 [Streptomyces sp. CC77]
MTHSILRKGLRSMIVAGAIAIGVGFAAQSENTDSSALAVHAQADHSEATAGTEEDHGWQ